MPGTDAPTPETLLSDQLLAAFRERAAGYDRDNRFFDEDFADLVRIGYPLMLVPREHGGHGFDLQQAAAAQRRLAPAAPATAPGINMHPVLVGVGHTLRLRGDARRSGEHTSVLPSPEPLECPILLY